MYVTADPLANPAFGSGTSNPRATRCPGMAPAPVVAMLALLRWPNPPQDPAGAPASPFTTEATTKGTWLWKVQETVPVVVDAWLPMTIKAKGCGLRPTISSSETLVAGHRHIGARAPSSPDAWGISVGARLIAGTAPEPGLPGLA